MAGNATEAIEPQAIGRGQLVAIGMVGEAVEAVLQWDASVNCGTTGETSHNKQNGYQALRHLPLQKDNVEQIATLLGFIEVRTARRFRLVIIVYEIEECNENECGLQYFSSVFRYRSIVNVRRVTVNGVA